MLCRGLRRGPGFSGDTPTVLLDLFRVVRPVGCAGDTMVGTLMGRWMDVVPGEEGTRTASVLIERKTRLSTSQKECMHPVRNT